MKQACKYNIIRFQPYAETEEFANIGVLIYAPKTCQLLFKVLPANQYGRITHFFTPLDKGIFQGTVAIIRAELKRIQKMLNGYDKPNLIYEELIRTREDIIRYSNHGVVMCEDPDQTLNELFDHYVQRSFAKKAGHEERMRQKIGDLLKSHQLDGCFKNKKVGDERYAVAFPFVAGTKKPTIIKPIHFRHPHSKQLIDHGLHWLFTMTQLFRNKNAFPDQTLFAYAAPSRVDGALHNAFSDIKLQIEEQGIQMLDIAEADAITRFAQKVLD